MSNIIRLPHDPHQECQLLLPWYATGQLEPNDRARVEAHLNACEACRHDLAVERRLEAEVAAMPLEVERGWSAMRRSIVTEERPRGGALALWSAGAPWVGWGMAAVFAIFAATAGLGTRPAQPALYHALSSAAPPSGNLLVMFRPETPEGVMAETIRASGARVADGPTAAGAYVLRSGAGGRDKALASLRANASVVMAEPVGAGGAAP